jgi:DUF971 family protein
MSNELALNPTELVIHQHSRVLDIAFSNGQQFRIPFELMRVFSPSAEVQGHGPGQETLQTGKRDVGIIQVEPVGNYGIRPTFSDGHDSGIFTWTYLHHLGQDAQSLWSNYELRLQAADASRDTPMRKPQGQSCGHPH